MLELSIKNPTPPKTGSKQTTKLNFTVYSIKVCIMYEDHN